MLESCAKGRVVRHVEVRDAGVLHGVGVRGLRDALEGRRFGTPERHGKWLLARTGGPTLVLHFGMTGRLVCGRPDDAVEAHDRVLFTLSGNRQLRFRDQRKLQGLWLARDDSDLDRLLGRQGPDAMAVDRADFEAVLFVAPRAPEDRAHRPVRPGRPRQSARRRDPVACPAAPRPPGA
ncbi:Formamidopyrimidine-DNA glycosylase [Streptomyces violarus]